MANLDEVIKNCVEDIWSLYDVDGNGTLDKDETRQFVKNTLKEMDPTILFDDEDFDQCFKEFDQDGSGTIEKDEMAGFIKNVAGLGDDA